MLSLATGHDVGYLTGPVAGGRESYYTGAAAAGEPAGLWYGAGAEALGLRGEVHAELMEAVYSHLLDPRDPNTAARATWGQAEALAQAHRAYRSADDIYRDLIAKNPGADPERQAELRAQAERSARQAVSFIDATFSAPKSVTVLGVAFERAANDARAAGDDVSAAAWAAHQRAVEDAVLAGARAAIEYLQAEAGYSRAGHHGGGAGQWIDAHDFVVAQFLQHDSRDRDPQLHVHQAILNRVQCADGTWRTLDSRALHAMRGAAGAIAERVMEAHLARALGLRFETRPDGRAREIVGVPQDVIDMFSSRRRAVTAKATELIDAYRARHGREPSALERTQISQRATLITRAAKSHDGETLEQRLDRWEAQTRAQLSGGLTEVARMVLDRAQQGDPAAAWSERDVIERALANLGDARQSWTRSDLTRALSDALPGHLDIDPADVPVLLAGLTEAAIAHGVQIVPDEDTDGLTDDLLRADGRSVYENPTGALYATSGQLAAERALREAAVERGAPALEIEAAAAVVTRFAEHGRELGADQAAAVRGILTSGARMEVLSAAAGTGKSFVVGALAEGWEAGRVFGLAPSQVAAGVLAGDGVTATNVTRWLGAQERLHRPGMTSAIDEAWRLREGDLLVVDEAGMTSTADLAAVQDRCAAAGAKLLLVGDPRQLAAVGPGGALADVAEHGVRYQLAEVRRFSAAWEGSTSLQLRDGDPAALDQYDKHGRLRDGGTAEQAEAAASRAWLADTLAGRESLLLLGSNEAADRAGAALRAELVALGRVAEHGIELTAHAQVAGVGDRVQARHNAWDLVGHDGNTRAPINRENYTVTGVRDDGGLRAVDGAGVEITLPAAYVQEHVALSYAATVHSAQGRTVDTAHSVLGNGGDAGAAYVALTRGRDGNWAYVVTRNVGADAPTGSTLDTRERSARAVLGDVLATERPDSERTATGLQEDAARDAVSAQRNLNRLAAEIATATAGRTETALDRLAAEGVLLAEQRHALAADPAFDGIGRVLRSAELAGRDPDEVLRAAVAERDLDGARSPAKVLHSRISTSLDGQLTPQIGTYRDLIPAGLSDDRRERLEHLADAADDRRHQLGSEVALDPPPWASEALGDVPDDAMERAEWETRAGWTAAYRETAGHTDDTDPLGAAPPAGLAETHAAWRAAHQALDLPDAGADEAEMSDGQLRARVRAYEQEKVWAPAWVAEDLSAAEQAAHRCRADAEVWGAHAAVAEDPDEARRLREDAAAARAKVDGFDAEIERLAAADQARGRWYLETVVTRDKAERSRAALGDRGVDLDDPREQVTADEWLAAHRAEQAEDEQHREVTEDDVDDQPLDRPTEDDRADQLETDVVDVRDADSTADLVARAQAALAEIDARAAEEALAAQEQDRQEQLTRWHTDDQATNAAAGLDEPVMER